MQEIFKQFKVKIIPSSIQRVQMDDATYFSPAYDDYVSNSKLGLLNPTQGGSPQKFLEGFKKGSTSDAFSLGSAVHQLTLEPEIYELSPIVKPSGKLGNVYIKYQEYRKKGEPMEKSIILACSDIDYYKSEIVNTNTKGIGLPARLKTAIKKVLPYALADKPEKTPDGKTLIYLTSDLYDKCVGCTNSLKSHKVIQKALNWTSSYCEDVILCDIEVSFPKDFNDSLSEMLTTTVKVKIKIDNWTIDHDLKLFVLNDLKTTGKPVQYFMGYKKQELGFLGERNEIFIPGSFQVFHYHRQMGMYLYVLNEYVKKEFGEGYKSSANMLVVETIASNQANNYQVIEEHIRSGFAEFSELLKRAAYHQVKGYKNILEFEKDGIPDNLTI